MIWSNNLACRICTTQCRVSRTVPLCKQRYTLQYASTFIVPYLAYIGKIDGVPLALHDRPIQYVGTIMLRRYQKRVKKF